ncbi:MAG: hypothetical protein JXA82_15805 [Sedimentisphaerales bacterium]|nr:hypothetical protein [Sedimentisphaerales bacterium]
MDHKENKRPRISTSDEEQKQGYIPRYPLYLNLLSALVLLLVLWAIPHVWKQVEPFHPGMDYRIPYVLSEDYWIYDRYCQMAANQFEILILGDSVVWGHYVDPDQVLSSQLNHMAGKPLFANMGIDGIHPVAMAGLVRYYGQAISYKKVLLCFNPLWITSEKHDLQSRKEFRFNHPRLVPQFFPEIPCYTESASVKIGNLMERHSQFLSWTRHVKTVYFEGLDLSSWVQQKSYQNPCRAVTFQLPQPRITEQSTPPWNIRSATLQAFPWVKLETSFQWQFFRQTIRILEKRDNTVFVLIGSFNEHMMDQTSLETYRIIQAQIASWLQTNQIPFLLPSSLPSEFYADASHPLTAGYALLANHLWNDESFQIFLCKPNNESK